MNFKQFNKKRYYVLATTLILVVIPAIVNFLMSFKIVKVYGDTNAWVGFLGTYIGSILSGILTLVGVLLTIRFTQKESEKAIQLTKEESQRAIDFTKREARKEKLPLLINNVQECIDYVDNCLYEMEALNGRNLEEILYQPPYERGFNLFEIDDNYQLIEKAELTKLKNEHIKYIRRNAVQINSTVYKAFIKLTNDINQSYIIHIEDIKHDLSLFEAYVMNNYFDFNDMIMISEDGKLVDITLNTHDTETIQNIKSRLYNKELEYLSGIEEAYYNFNETLAESLGILSEEFFKIE